MRVDPEERVLWQSIMRHVSARRSVKVHRSLGDFCENRLRVVDKQGRDVPFKLNPIQRHVVRAKQAFIADGKLPKFLILKYRQGGVTTLEQAASYERVVSNANQRVLTLAEVKDKTAEIFLMVSHFYENDDPEVRPPRKGVGNAQRLILPGLNSRFLCGTAAGRTAGRGGTYQRIHGSEVAWWCPGGDQVAKQRAINAGLSQAAGDNEVVYETTPNGLEFFHELWEESKRGENDWNRIFLRWFDDEYNRIILDDEQLEEVMATLSDEERALVEEHFLDGHQIAWRRKKQRELGPLFAQEHPEDDVSCFLLSGTSRFDTASITMILRHLSDYTTTDVPGVSYTELDGGGYKVVWEKPNPTEEYVAGADTSEGLDTSDPNGVGIMARSNMRQVAAIHGRWTPRELATRGVELCAEYNNAVLGVERQNHGHAVIERVCDLGYQNLYYHIDGKIGWSTDKVTRPLMLEEMYDSIVDGVDNRWVRDRDMLKEALTFTRQGTKWEASPGSHDDCLIKWMIALMVRKMGPVSGGPIRGDVEY